MDIPNRLQYHRFTRANLITGSKNPNDNVLIRLGRILLVLVPLVNVLWYPLVTLVNVAGSQNVVPMDMLLTTLWIIGLMNLATRRQQISLAEKQAWWIVVLANMPLFLSPLASGLAANGTNLLVGILIHLKRLGLASILAPLAVQCQLHHSRQKLMLFMVISTVLLLFGGPALVGLNNVSVTEFQLTTGRNVSLLYNPNTLGIVTGIYFLIFLANINREAGKLYIVIMTVSIVLASYTFQSAASRTATIALVPALLYQAARRRTPFVWLLLLWAVMLGFVLVTTSDSLRQSLFVVRFLGIERIDQNFSARFIIQTKALSQSLNWPIGTGIGNLGLAIYGTRLNLSTTDSLYVDYLMSLGAVGLFSMLTLLIRAWRVLESNYVDAIAARSVIIYIVIVSISSLGLASNFVSPLYFLILGLGISSAGQHQIQGSPLILKRKTI